LISQELEKRKSENSKLKNQLTNQEKICCCKCANQDACVLNRDSNKTITEANFQENSQLISFLVEKSVKEQENINTSFCRECEMEQNFEQYLK
jgi:hypothetical protein